MNKVLYFIIAIVAMVVGIFVFQKSQYLPMPEQALYYSKPRAIKAFSMTDHQGDIFDKSSFENNWTWLFFGYTSCPDVCPTTLQELNFAYPDLEAITDNNQVVLVSVDPNRDSQEKLAQYIDYFHKDFVAVRAGHEVLFPFARNVGLMYAISDDNAARHISPERVE